MRLRPRPRRCVAACRMPRLAGLVGKVARKKGKKLTFGKPKRRMKNSSTVDKRGNMTQKNRLLLIRYLSGKPLKAASRDKAESLITGLKSLATMAQKKEEEALKLTQTVMTEEDRLAREAELAGEDKKASPVKRRWDIIRTVLGGADDSGSDDDGEEDDAERATPTPT